MEQLVELSDKTRLWTTVSGQGVPAVFVNGGPGMADYLDPVSALLAAHFRIYRFEQRGCGRSDAGGPYTLRTFVSDMDELRKRWDIDRWYVVGHSWGVDLGLAYALQHPCSTLGLVGLSGGRVHNDRSWKRIYDENKHREEAPPAAAEPSVQVNNALNEDWKDYCRAPDLLSNLSMLSVPALFLYGDSDVRPSWPTEQISSLMPRAEFHRITGADHHMWQGNPEEMCKLILGFLDQQATRK